VVEGACFLSLHQGSASLCMLVTPAVPYMLTYMLTGLAGCSVDPGISCGACKLARTPRVIKKNHDIKLINFT
jgi:hypothetical protein